METIAECHARLAVLADQIRERDTNNDLAEYLSDILNGGDNDTLRSARYAVVELTEVLEAFDE